MAKKAKKTKRERRRAEAPAVTEPAVQPEAVQKAPAAAKSGWRSYFPASLLLLGFFMVCGGVAFIFVDNWHTLSKLQRGATAFIPVIAGFSCGVYTIVKDKGRAWREVSAIFTAAGFAALTVLIARIYNTSEYLDEIYVIVMAAWLPLVYVFRSQALSALCCVSLLIFIAFDKSGWVEDGFFHCVAILPFMAYYLFFHKPAGPLTVWMRYVCLIPLAYLLDRFNLYGLDCLRMNLFAAAGLLYTAGLHYSEKGIRDWRNPWIACGWLSLTALLAITSYRPHYFLRLGELYRYEGIPAYKYLSGLWLALFAAQLFFTARRPAPLKVTVTLVTLLPISCYLLRVPQKYAFLYGAAAFLLLGVVTLAEGIKRRGHMKANAGMLQITLLAVIGWIIFDKSSLTLSAIFVAACAAFIVMNAYIGRKTSGERACVPAEGGA